MGKRGMGRSDASYTVGQLAKLAGVSARSGTTRRRGYSVLRARRAGIVCTPPAMPNV